MSIFYWHSSILIYSILGLFSFCTLWHSSISFATMFLLQGCLFCTYLSSCLSWCQMQHFYLSPACKLRSRTILFFFAGHHDDISPVSYPLIFVQVVWLLVFSLLSPGCNWQVELCSCRWFGLIRRCLRRNRLPQTDTRSLTHVEW